MKTKKQILLPSSQRALSEMGENIKLARLRRRLTVAQIAERADVSAMSVWHVEKGSPSVAMGIYYRILLVLGLEGDLVKIASEDSLGRKLQDADLMAKTRIQS